MTRTLLSINMLRSENEFYIMKTGMFLKRNMEIAEIHFRKAGEQRKITNGIL